MGLSAGCPELPEFFLICNLITLITDKTKPFGSRLIVVTLNRQSSERIVAGGESSVGEDGGVDPGQEVGDAGVHVRNVL